MVLICLNYWISIPLSLMLVWCNAAQATRKVMKRQYVIPDLLASLTADALFGVGTHLHPDEAAAVAEAARRRSAQTGRLSAWLKGRRRGAPKAQTGASPASTNVKELK
jgi:hypothetical protein